MKLRIEKNSIRLRLSPDEIKKFFSKKELSETVYISHKNFFKYSLKITESNDFGATFEDKNLLINVPANEITEWINSKKIGIERKIIADNDMEVMLIVEEDLPKKKKR